MRRMIPLFLVTVAIFGVLVTGSLRPKEDRSGPVRDLKARFQKKHVSPVDHSKLPALQKNFASGSEVTEACISCHTERHKEVLKSVHWNWAGTEYIAGRGLRTIGKKNVLNNYCIGVSSNLEGCDKCHAGYGFKNANYNFDDPKNIDCLICHDTTDTYIKGNGGLPAPEVNLKAVAQKVGRPTRSDCGSCHFLGGGGNNVKHGDLEMALLNTSREVDVHMGTDGGNLQCVDCHKTQSHQIAGKMYSISSMNRNRSSCEQCHGEAPHSDSLINKHSAKVACQTCHIPIYAKVNATKMSWDWSTAGKLKDGKPYEVKNADGEASYLSIKGSFVWEKNVKPDYIWFNGTAGHYLLGDKVGSARPVEINSLHGSYDDPDAKITPVKIHHGRQIYDPVNQTLIQPKLFSEEAGDGGFWKDFNWQRSAEAGMKEVNLPYSGKYEFIDTVMYWPVNHMVSPKSKAVGCVECHTRNNSRLAKLTDFYMPGRDRKAVVDGFGTVLVAGAFLGALLHALARLVMRRKRGAQA